MDRPESIQSLYSNVPQAEWFSDNGNVSNSNLNIRMAEILEKVDSAVGKPLLWYPIKQRIFVVGESDTAWIEMSARWKNRPLRD